MGSRFSQFDKIVEVLSKKPFANKVDSKYYSNMYVIHFYRCTQDL
jgi:hypothetical protein